MRDMDAAGAVVAHSYQEHLESETLFRTIQASDAMNVDWVSGARKLKQALQHHIHEEEGKVFSAAKKLFTNDEAVVMAEVFNKMKPEIKKQSMLGQSIDMMVNMMPGRLRDSFAKFTKLPVAS
jgi:hemerythrin-like domain-containing protein